MTIKQTVAGIVWCCVCLNGWTQTAKQAADVEDTRARMTALRDAFVHSVHEAGFTCPIAVPPILVEDVPSFGSYDTETNTLRTSAWSLLKPAESEMFFRLMGPNATETDAKQEFEDGVHHWVIVHELGHWFQACHGVRRRQRSRTPWNWARTGSRQPTGRSTILP